MSSWDFTDPIEADEARKGVAEGRLHGRIYSKELIEHVLSRLAQGETLTSISHDLGFSSSIWAKWLKDDPTLEQAHDYARKLGADVIADNILSIVDDVPEDGTAILKARLRSDMRLRLLAKWQPDRYGDKAEVKHTGHDGGALQVSYVDVAQIAREMRSLAAGRAPGPLLEQHDGDGDDVL